MSVPTSLAKRGLTQVRDNLGPGDRVAVPARQIVDAFFDEIRARLSEHVEPAPPAPAPKPAPRQSDLPGMASPELLAAYERAGLSAHLSLQQALDDPATRRCLEIMADNNLRR